MTQILSQEEKDSLADAVKALRQTASVLRSSGVPDALLCAALAHVAGDLIHTAPQHVRNAAALESAKHLMRVALR